MRCFYYFKDRNRTRPTKSNTTDVETAIKSSGSDKTETERTIKPSCSSGTSPRSIPEMSEERAKNILRVFAYSELSKATCNFNKLLKIGEGGFGCVYKASIKPVDGNGKPTIVAIKKLNSDSYQGHKQWIAEVQFLSVVDHPNYVKLIGYCAVDGHRGTKQRLLVYEFIPNKSLDDHLFNKAIPPLPWERRLKIMLGAAQGLAYLHEELEIQVIYRDFKASNVLLDEEFRPKLSDFGLAREGPSADHTHVSTKVVGTYGYAAPDYVKTGHLTSKSDVWSFGVVLYEILTGRRSLEKDRPRSEQKLIEWIKRYPANSRRFGSIMDPRLDRKFSLDAARKVAELADTCLSKSAKDRPTMGTVVETLKEIIMLQVSDVESPSTQRCEDDAGEDEQEDDEEVEKPAKETGLSESAKRRMEHLAKLSENLGGVNRRQFMVMQT